MQYAILWTYMRGDAYQAAPHAGKEKWCRKIQAECYTVCSNTNVLRTRIQIFAMTNAKRLIPMTACVQQSKHSLRLYVPSVTGIPVMYF